MRSLKGIKKGGAKRSRKSKANDEENLDPEVIPSKRSRVSKDPESIVSPKKSRSKKLSMNSTPKSRKKLVTPDQRRTKKLKFVVSKAKKPVGDSIDVNYYNGQHKYEDDYKRLMIGPIEFAKEKLEETYQTIVDKSGTHLTEDSIELAKRLTMKAVELNHKISFELEHMSKEFLSKSSGLQRDRIQGDYKKEKDRNFKEPGVQAILTSIVGPIQENELLIETLKDELYLTGEKSTGTELAHAAQVASQKGNLASSSELVAELMPKQHTETLF